MLTKIVGRHKLDTDTDHDDLRFANWDALKFCLAVVSFAITKGRDHNPAHNILIFLSPPGLPHMGVPRIRPHPTLSSRMDPILRFGEKVGSSHRKRNHLDSAAGRSC
jgi:hypothetical protein